MIDFKKATLSGLALSAGVISLVGCAQQKTADYNSHKEFYKTARLAELPLPLCRDSDALRRGWGCIFLL